MSNSSLSVGEERVVIFKIQFLKQGPAYKKEGPGPNKGSDQQ